MHPMILLLVSLWTGSAFFPGALDRQLASAARRDLPVAFALDEAARLRVDFHHDPRAPRATYLGADASGPARLMLFAPAYLDGVGLRPVVDMQVDVCDPFFYALLDGYLRRQIGLPRSALGRELRQRAQATMRDVPRAHRVEAYLDAQASFGAHLLTLANELDRSDRRRRRVGTSLCHLIDRPLPLLRLWRAALGGGQFPGAYERGRAPGRPVVYFSRSVLDGSDKRFLVTRVLGADWNGSVDDDLVPRYCGT